MSFNSLEFAIFLPAVFVIYWALPHKYRWQFILGASYVFYMSWEPKYAVLLLFVTSAAFFAAPAIEKTEGKKKKGIMAAAGATCLSVLFVFKYYDFFIGSFVRAAARFGITLYPYMLRLVLPVGISFYTLQSLSYLFDVYRGEREAERNFGIFAAYVAFFPQLVAGPIERTKNLLPQLKAEHTFNYAQAAYGLRLLTWGYFKKLVIADSLAPHVDMVFSRIHAYRGFALVLALFFFSIQIYCDFSAYSDIARGAAKLLGIELSVNFRSPYFAASFTEFWNRWNISLSTWFRDYLYIPLGGNRKGKARKRLNLMITFLTSGLWHGADWTYVIWMGIHGMIVILEDITGWGKRNPENLKSRLIRALPVFLLSLPVCAWFRAQSVNDAFYLFRHMFDGISKPFSYLYNGFSAGFSIGKLAWYAACITLLAAYDCASLKTDVTDWVGRRPFVVRHGIYCLMITVILLFHAVGEVEFVYFRF